MAPRSSWKGFIRLSLVSVPVKAYTANATGADIRLNQLHKECNQRVQYKKTCPEHGELSADQIVNGYEYSKGQYVVIDPAEVAKLRPKGDQSIQVHGFVDPEAIGSLYFAGKNYYLVPDGPVGQKPYALLRDGMLDRGVEAFAQVVLSGREQLVLLRPVGDLLVMTVLLQDAKVKKPESFEDELVQTECSADEFKLTKTLIDASKFEDFDYAKFKDNYVEKMTEVIQKKVDGEEIVQVAASEAPKIINIMDALKASVARAQAGAAESSAEQTKPKRKQAGEKKMAPSAKPKPARKKKSG